jgi:hypothetical protein
VDGPGVDAWRTERELGLARAAIVVWVSSALASIILGMFVSPVAWAMIAGSGRHIDARWGSVLLVVGINALLGAIGVTLGVGLFGYRLGYPSAFVALAVGGIVQVGFTRFLVAHSTGTPDALALPAIAPLLWRVSLLLTILLPAVIVNGLAAQSYPPAADAPPEPPFTGRSPYV